MSHTNSRLADRPAQWRGFVSGTHDVSRSIDGNDFNLHICQRRFSLTLEIFVTSMLDTDDESDEDIVNIASQEIDDSNSKEVRGNKRPRSRSKSLTPPPEVPMNQILNVRHVIR